MPTPLHDAFDDFTAALSEAGAFVRDHPFTADPENRASGYAFLISVLMARLEENVAYDADQPYFRVIDRRTREGSDNPDQRYLIAPVRGGESYRVWGRLGSARRLELQIYSGDPYLGGRTGSFLTFEDLVVAEDGSFEVALSPERAPGNWLENPPDATKLFVRQVYSEWTDEPPGEVHIDRVGHEGDAAAALTEDDMAARLRATAATLRSHVRVWPEIVGHILAAVPPNALGEPRDSRDAGGVPGRWMVNGHFDLADDEALVVTASPSEGDYQGIQLMDLWMESLEYANRQTSLTADQAQQSSDGTYRFVVSARDPGVANWLDTVGRRRGLVFLRYDGTGTDAFDPARRPTAQKVALADLDAVLPPGTARVSPAERRSAIAARRKHVQIRFGN
jgi:hypothetical protein